MPTTTCTPRLQRGKLALDRLPAVDGQHRHAAVAAVAVHGLGHLHGELARRRHDQRLHRARCGIEPLDQRQRERRGLAGAGGGAAQHVAAGQKQRDRPRLDRRRLLVAELLEHAQHLGGKAERLETGASGVWAHDKGTSKVGRLRYQTAGTRPHRPRDEGCMS